MDLFSGYGQALDADAYGVFDGVGDGGGYWGLWGSRHALYVVRAYALAFVQQDGLEVGEVFAGWGSDVGVVSGRDAAAVYFDRFHECVADGGRR